MITHGPMPSPSYVGANKNNNLDKSSVPKSAQIPAELSKFKAWADRECVSWPGWLQAKAYNAWLSGDVTDFITEYDAFRRG